MALGICLLTVDTYYVLKLQRATPTNIINTINMEICSIICLNVEGCCQSLLRQSHRTVLAVGLLKVFKPGAPFSPVRGS